MLQLKMPKRTLTTTVGHQGDFYVIGCQSRYGKLESPCGKLYGVINRKLQCLITHPGHCTWRFFTEKDGFFARTERRRINGDYQQHIYRWIGSGFICDDEDYRCLSADDETFSHYIAYSDNYVVWYGGDFFHIDPYVLAAFIGKKAADIARVSSHEDILIYSRQTREVNVIRLPHYGGAAHEPLIAPDEMTCMVARTDGTIYIIDLGD